MQSPEQSITEQTREAVLHQKPLPWQDYCIATAAVAAVTGASFWLKDSLPHVDLIMFYLVAVVIVANKLRRGAAFLASVLSVLAYDFFFVPPEFDFVPSDERYIPTLIIMTAVALTISQLSATIKRQAQEAAERERRAVALSCLSKDFALTKDVDELVSSAVQHIGDTFGCGATILLSDEGNLNPYKVGAVTLSLDDEDMKSAKEALQSGKLIIPGQSNNSMGSPSKFFVPLIASHATIGVLALNARSVSDTIITAAAATTSGAMPRQAYTLAHLMNLEKLNLLQTFAYSTALALERANLSEAARKASLMAETERIRSALLSSVSHDLRTPLAAITGAASSLLDDNFDKDLSVRLQLVDSIYKEADRLNRLVGNLLDMTRLESGSIQVKKDWYSLEEIIGSALTRLEKRLSSYNVKVEIPADLPLVSVDDVLMEQLFINILDNAVKYAPAGTTIAIAARADEGKFDISVQNDGPSFSEGEEAKIFDKFYRGSGSRTAGGAGLGLAVCRGIVESHNGKIWAENAEPKGVVFHMTLPLEKQPELKEEVTAETMNG